jgi:hypothetical protein
VVSEARGSWGKARQVRGTRPESLVNGIACPGPGDCTAAGYTGGPHSTAFLVNEKHGSWRTAFPVPGLAALSNGRGGALQVISCPSPGNCTAAGCGVPELRLRPLNCLVLDQLVIFMPPRTRGSARRGLRSVTLALSPGR